MTTEDKYVARFDGGCRINPGGPGSAACLITLQCEEVHRESVLLPACKQMSNNVAEYAGMLLILMWAKENPHVTNLQIIGDSTIVINCMRRKRASEGLCASISRECLKLAAALPIKVKYEWQRRHANEECDAMCDLELDEEEYRQRMEREGFTPS